ncbi:alpha/beta hydrolase [Virgibacillus halophilus]|uniref:Alpha/beta hydrolase-fold protein n=1 Tax=Tigheibacillus halophilus TaxID=361280 RepID=A0ABU5C9U0_9BACI|nr:alpha/beta hydrolase-fold protein [Virgibacillus halophilus]
MRRKGKMTEHKIDSVYLKETMTLKIYQSENYSSLYKQNLCIMQDGNDYYQLGRAATFSDRLHEARKMENTVFAGIHYKDKFDRRKKYHPDGAEQNNYVKFLAKEVVPFLDDLLPTYLMGQTRALLGDSLAGTIALMTALKYPHTFGKIIMQSPYVDEKVLQAVKDAPAMDGLKIYHTIGTAETDVTMTDNKRADFLASNRRLHDALQAKNTSYYYRELPEGEHTWKYWQNDLSNALTTMFGSD